MKKIAALALLTLAAACDRGPEPVPPEVATARRQATRAACIANQLLQRAEDNVQTLETADLGGDPATGSAVLVYARAYQQHAALRSAALAQIDSARNRSATEADSVRHAQAAARYSVSPPEAGTLEANVFQAYERDFGALAADPDHPCNWELEEEQPRRER